MGVFDDLSASISTMTQKAKDALSGTAAAPALAPASTTFGTAPEPPGYTSMGGRRKSRSRKAKKTRKARKTRKH